MGTHCQAAPFEGSRFSLLFKNTYFTMAETAETTTTVPEVPTTEVEANGTTEATTNGDKAETTTNGDSTNGEEVKETTNGEEVTEGEATKRKADTPDDAEEESAEKIAKLKEVAAEKLTEAEEKLPAEPLTEAEPWLKLPLTCRSSCTAHMSHVTRRDMCHKVMFSDQRQAVTDGSWLEAVGAGFAGTTVLTLNF